MSSSTENANANVNAAEDEEKEKKRDKDGEKQVNIDPTPLSGPLASSSSTPPPNPHLSHPPRLIHVPPTAPKRDHISAGEYASRQRELFRHKQAMKDNSNTYIPVTSSTSNTSAPKLNSNREIIWCDQPNTHPPSCCCVITQDKKDEDRREGWIQWDQVDLGAFYNLMQDFSSDGNGGYCDCHGHPVNLCSSSYDSGGGGMDASGCSGGGDSGCGSSGCGSGGGCGGGG
nr:uncharacterized protein I203_03374 [Kwoniella mangroviensis CBS 8507]OCF67676.1 hypothetical protein I203_03374 [Kwoniella mangroviensis CBS 8507]